MNFQAPDALPFTGERFIPTLGGNIMLEHFHRYMFALEFVAGCDVLDIACGEGYGTDLLGCCAKTVVGVDIAEEVVVHASKKYSSAKVAFRQGRAESIPLEDSTVDVVVSFETIEHHDKHEEMIAEIRRVLRPGGLLLISSPDKRYYSDISNFKNVFHVKELYKPEFLSLLSKSFSHVSMYGQKIVFGSAIFAEGNSHGLLTFADDQNIHRAGFADALYNVALASDDLARICAAPSSLMEYNLYKSEAMGEKFRCPFNREPQQGVQAAAKKTSLGVL